MSESATPATQKRHRCHSAPRLTHKMSMDVTKRHACHTENSSMSPRATPACHAKGTSMSPSATPAKQSGPAHFGGPQRQPPSAVSATPAKQIVRGCHQRCLQVRCLPRKVARCPRNEGRHQSQPSAVSAR